MRPQKKDSKLNSIPKTRTQNTKKNQQKTEKIKAKDEQKPNEMNPKFLCVSLHLVADVTEPERTNEAFEKEKKTCLYRYEANESRKEGRVDCAHKYEMFESWFQHTLEAFLIFRFFSSLYSLVIIGSF